MDTDEHIYRNVYTHIYIDIFYVFEVREECDIGATLLRRCDAALLASGL